MLHVDDDIRDVAIQVPEFTRIDVSYLKHRYALKFRMSYNLGASSARGLPIFKNAIEIK